MDKCEESFQELKRRLTSAPILVIPDVGKLFEVYCDVSHLGLGCILMQEKKAVAYVSRQLKVHERNYPTHDLELAAIVFALKIWRHYLYGAQFRVFSDHKSLKCSTLTISNDFLDLIKERQLLDASLNRVREQLGSDKARDFALGDDGILRFQGRVCIPNDAEVKQLILEEGHKSRLRNEEGRGTVCISMFDVPEGEGRTLETRWDSTAFGDISVEMGQGHDTIWVIVDRLIKSAHFLAMNLRMSMAKLAQLYVKEIVRLHGVPSSIVFDRYPRFTSRFWQTLQEALGTKLTMSSAYHPQTDGQSERTIQSLEDLLQTCILDHLEAWDELFSRSQDSSASYRAAKASVNPSSRIPCMIEGFGKIVSAAGESRARPGNLA
ncbi:uncharacterized protein LOC114184353 [Vigna unguiculata]|uniref:uncharacterized protein LOC114184353 n=1 Tax=Vigna unguiculata TaxID=3917 RepID=UPI001016016C|nr:uncharacterized protein LOC114184353 [Vigna unguiculata]